jgi:predicted GTPase
MAFNPMAFATPQQKEQLAQMQQFTQKVRCTIHTEDNRVEVSLETDDEQAAQLIPQLQEGIVGSVSHMLYQMFGVTGKRV